VPTVEPAVEGLEFESEELPDGRRRYRITAGTATWEGQDLETCERQLNDWGRVSFMREAQQEVDEVEDGLWKRERDIDPHRISSKNLPRLERIVVGVDPPRSTGQCGIVVGGRATVNGVKHYYTLEDCSPPPNSSTGTWCHAVIDAFNRWNADAVVVEVNFGGRMVKYSLKQTKGGENLKVIEVTASRGKLVRAEPVQGLAEEGRDHHVGVFVELEKEKCSYKAGDESPNRMDADVWAKTELMGHTPRRSVGSFSFGGSR
jgi:phage terminase large subunit-like protein